MNSLINQYRRPTASLNTMRAPGPIGNPNQPNSGLTKSPMGTIPTGPSTNPPLRTGFMPTKTPINNPAVPGPTTNPIMNPNSGPNYPTFTPPPSPLLNRPDPLGNKIIEGSSNPLQTSGTGSPISTGPSDIRTGFMPTPPTGPSNLLPGQTREPSTPENSNLTKIPNNINLGSLTPDNPTGRWSPGTPMTPLTSPSGNINTGPSKTPQTFNDFTPEQKDAYNTEQKRGMDAINKAYMDRRMSRTLMPGEMR